MADPIGTLESQTARLLADANHLAYLASKLEDQPVPDRNERKRLKAAVKRARTIREAILDAGVKMPALRAPGENPEELQEQRTKLRKDLEALQELTVSQIAALAGVHRITAGRWIEKIGGQIGAKYAEAHRRRIPAVFTREEAQAIMRRRPPDVKNITLKHDQESAIL